MKPGGLNIPFETQMIGALYKMHKIRNLIISPGIIMVKDSVYQYGWFRVRDLVEADLKSTATGTFSIQPEPVPEHSNLVAVFQKFQTINVKTGLE